VRRGNLPRGHAIESELRSFQANAGVGSKRILEHNILSQNVSAVLSPIVLPLSQCIRNRGMRKMHQRWRCLPYLQC
jgi:hypothetical protein